MARKARLPVARMVAIAMLTVSVAPKDWAQAIDRISAPVSSREIGTLPGSQPSWAQPQADIGAVPADLRLSNLTLVLARTPEVQQAFEQFLKNQQDPASSDYHRWLTPLEVGERFGISTQDINAIKQWLQSHNLQVDSVSSSRIRVNFSGTAAAVGSALGSELHYFASNGSKRISLAGTPKVPAALAPTVAGIHGLSSISYRPLHKNNVGRFATNSAEPNLTLIINNQPVNLIMPADFAVIYDLNPVYAANITGAGQTIAIIGRSRVYDADIENFQLTVGMNVQDPTLIIPPDGFDPGPPQTVPPPNVAPSGDQAEATFDVIRAGSTAPGANIALVVSASAATTDGIAIAAPYVVDTTPVPARIMSLSFSACENEVSQQGVAFWDSVFSQAAAEGISVFVASGDSGAAGCEVPFQPPSTAQVLSPNALCSSAYVTCVGGTEFADFSNPGQYWSPNNNPVTFGSALSYIPEGAWNEPSNPLGTQAASSGGGVSSYVPTPFWQAGPGVPANRTGRYTPDVAFSSSEHDAYFGCFAAGGGDCLTFFVDFFGTSAAAPAMAGVAALLNQKTGSAQGNLNPTLYRLWATSNGIFHDVTVATSGVGTSSCSILTPSMCNNSTPSNSNPDGDGLPGYLVGPGYDAVTGLGSLDVANFLSGWSTTGVNLSSTTTALSSSANPADAGSPVTLTATVTSTGAHPPTGTVTFLDGPDTLGTAALNSAGVATFTTSSLPLGKHSIAAIYPGDSNNPGSTSASLTEAILASNLLPVVTALSPASAYAGGPAFTLTVAGANFMPGSTVLWNGHARPTTYFSGGGQLQASIGASDVVATGNASVMVSNAAPGGGLSNSENFAVLENFSGSSGYLSMFLSGANLGNSALYQNNGLLGLNTTAPQAALDVNLNTPTASPALNTTIVLGNTTPINTVATSMFMTFVDKSQAQNLSKQTTRFIYERDASATGGVQPGAYDTLLTTGAFLHADTPYQLRGIDIEGPQVDPGRTLTNYTGMIITGPYGGGTVSSVNAILTAPGSGNVGLGTLGPATALQVVGDVRVGTSGSNGCLQNFSGGGLVGTCSSDARLKNNILPFAPVLDKLVRLQPVHFEWKTDQYPQYHFGPGRNAGLLAQEVEKVFPEMVTADEHGFKMVNYSELPYLTLAAVRELKAENDSLREQLGEVQARLQRLEMHRSAVRGAARRRARRRSLAGRAAQ